jgi:hypothetical protein
MTSFTADPSKYLRLLYSAMDGSNDAPTAFYYKELYQAFPNASFILTTRDTESWLKSFDAHLDRRQIQYGGVPPAFGHFLLQELMGHYLFNATLSEDAKEKHEAAVIALIPPSQLLVIDISAGKGWDQLCPFLVGRSVEVNVNICNPARGEFQSSNAGGDSRRENLIQSTKGFCADEPGSGFAIAIVYNQQPNKDEERRYMECVLVLAESLRAVNTTADILVLSSAHNFKEGRIIERIFTAAGLKVHSVGPVAVPIPAEPFEPWSPHLSRWPSKAFLH